METPDLPGMNVFPKPGRRPAERKLYKLYGVGTAVAFGVHNNSLVNLRRGIAERVLYLRSDEGMYTETVRPAVGVFSERLKVFSCKIKRHLPIATPIRRDQFPLLYSGRKQVTYMLAVESLRSKPVERRDSFTKTFTKAEKINFTAEFSEGYIGNLPEFSTPKDPAPRVIQPRDPRYNVEVGRYIKPVEGMVYRAIKRVWDEVTVAKGLNAQQRGKLIHKKWTKFRVPVAVGLDAKRFDQHVSVAALEWEHSIYRSMFGYDPEFAELLRWQLHTQGVGKARDGRVKYSVRGCRMSGDMNTALGNCLLMCAMVWAYCKQRNVRAELINDGDDCVVFMERSNLGNFQEGLDLWFREMGFVMKIEKPVYEIEQIEFCKCQPILTEDGYLMVRCVRTSLAKDSICLKPLDNEKVFRKWCREVGECGLSLTGGIPVVAEYYECLVRASSGIQVGRLGYDPVFESGMRMMAKGMNRRGIRVTNKTRVSFWKAFGITPDQQKLWEGYYRTFRLTYNAAEPTYEASPSFLLSRSIPQAFCYL